MKKIALVSAIVFLFSLAAFAQAKPDYSGEWSLDISKSKLNENARIESMTIKATQTATDIKVETDIKRTPNPNAGGGGQGGGGGRGMGGFGGGPRTYTLGKETTFEADGPNGVKIPNKLKADFDSDGKLKLSSSATFNNPNGGEITVSTNETWTLSDGGKTLTIARTTTSPRGEQSMTYVLTKK